MGYDELLLGTALPCRDGLDLSVKCVGSAWYRVSTCPLAGQVCGHRNSSHLDLQCMVSRRLYFDLVTVCRLQLAHQILPGQA